MLSIALMNLVVPVQEAVTSPLGAAALVAAGILLGYVSEKAYNGLKTILPWYDKLPSIVHQTLAPFVGLLLGFLATKFGLPTITDFASIDQPWIEGLLNGILNAAVMGGFFRDKKRETAAIDGTAAVENTRSQVVTS